MSGTNSPANFSRSTVCSDMIELLTCITFWLLVLPALFTHLFAICMFFVSHPFRSLANFLLDWSAFFKSIQDKCLWLIHVNIFSIPWLTSFYEERFYDRKKYLILMKSPLSFFPFFSKCFIVSFCPIYEICLCQGYEDIPLCFLLEMLWCTCKAAFHFTLPFYLNRSQLVNHESMSLWSVCPFINTTLFWFP